MRGEKFEKTDAFSRAQMTKNRGKNREKIEKNCKNRQKNVAGRDEREQHSGISMRRSWLLFRGWSVIFKGFYSENLLKIFTKILLMH